MYPEDGFLTQLPTAAPLVDKFFSEPKSSRKGVESFFHVKRSRGPGWTQMDHQPWKSKTIKIIVPNLG